MQASVSIDIGIREIRQLTGFIKETHGVDYTEYALTSFKRRVESFLVAEKHGLETLLKKLESKDFLDHFTGRIAVGATELFRDPTFWILLKNIYLANILKEQPKARIWLPMCASGEEFYSLAILLKESGWADRAEIYVSSMSNESLEAIKHGWMEHEKLEISTRNYARFQGAGQLTDYFKKAGDDINFDRGLFANTHFFREGLEFDHDLPPIHLILFRNRMIYFNPTLQYKVCDMLYNKLSARGLLALGILEEIELNINSKYAALNKEESIYQRKS
jgi:chemotaxis protein methyltransferase CheR